MLHRRQFLAGAAALSAAAPLSSAAAATSASRGFRILRSGETIGTHTLAATRDGSRIDIEIAIEIVVRVLGIPAYRYELTNREVWEGGAIVSVDSRVNDDGEDHFARVRRDGGMLMIEGSEYTGPAPLGAATTSYWVSDFLGRTPWISTQTGTPLAVTASQAGSAAGGTRWQIRGDFETNLVYDASGEWIGCEFDAGGEVASYERVAGSGSFTALWNAA